MLLHLQNGYPFPYPENLTADQQEEISESAAGVTLYIPGVIRFQWLHTVTVEFESFELAEQARRVTGWPFWGRPGRALEAQTSSPDGYEHPAIVANGKAYCGFILTAS